MNIRSSIQKTTLALAISPLFLFVATTAHAAAPDGFGPWADKVIYTNQGFRKNGQPVDPIRSNPTAALGVAENDTDPTHFYSLGFGGKITLGFKNGIKNGVVIVEATNPNSPIEKAKIEVSPDKDHWFLAGTVTQDGQVTIPRRAGCIHYVRVTDVSDKANFPDPTSDAYDVDGVRGEGEKCSIKNHDDKDHHDNDHGYNDKDHKYNDKDDKNYWGPYSPRREQEIDNGD